MNTRNKMVLATCLSLVALLLPFLVTPALAAWPQCISMMGPGDGHSECMDCCLDGYYECGLTSECHEQREWCLDQCDATYPV